MEPFSTISELVLESSRTTKTEAGGGKFKPVGHPEKLQIDTYTAIKKKGINATFACHVRESWGEPTFVLTIKDDTPTVIHIFTVDELDKAEARWAAVAANAMGNSYSI